MVQAMAKAEAEKELARANAKAEADTKSRLLAEQKRLSDERHNEALNKKRKRDEEVLKYDRKEAKIDGLWERIARD